MFIYNVNKDVTEEAITHLMKSSKELDIIESKSVSHVEARTKSFRIKVKAEDYEKATDGETSELVESLEDMEQVQVLINTNHV